MNQSEFELKANELLEETKNLASQFPMIATELHGIYKNWIEQATNQGGDREICLLALKRDLTISVIELFTDACSENPFSIPENVTNLKKKYNYLSPDGFSVCMENFDTPKEAYEFFIEWCKQFEQQGYYSANSRRIDLWELPLKCNFFIDYEDTEEEITE